MDFLDFIRKVHEERRARGFIVKGGPGSGWFAPPKGTHGKGISGKSVSYLAGKAKWNDKWKMGDKVKVKGNVYHATRLGKAMSIVISGQLGTETTPARITTDPQKLKGDVQWDAMIVLDGESLPKLTVQSGKGSIYHYEHERYNPKPLSIGKAIRSIYIDPDMGKGMARYSLGKIKELERLGIPVYWGLDGAKRAIDVL
jgi:hypothetical protein